MHEGRLDVRENETISVGPVWVLWVEVHELVEQDMGRRSKSHRCSGMPGVGDCGRIDLEKDQLALIRRLLGGEVLWKD